MASPVELQNVLNCKMQETVPAPDQLWETEKALEEPNPLLLYEGAHPKFVLDLLERLTW